MSADRRLEAVARTLNQAGWAYLDHELGDYDACSKCRRVCDVLARKVLAAADAATDE